MKAKAKAAPPHKPKRKAVHHTAAQRAVIAKKAAKTRLKDAAKNKAAAAKRHVAKVRAKAAAKPAYARPSLGAGWVACNEILPCCSAVAVANSLLAATGWRVADEDVYRLHFAAGGTEDEGAGLEAVMETLERRGLAGIRPSAAYTVDGFPDGAVAAVLVPGWDWHAVAVTGGLAASWGTLLDGEVLDYAHEVWAMEW